MDILPSFVRVSFAYVAPAVRADGTLAARWGDGTFRFPRTDEGERYGLSSVWWATG